MMASADEKNRLVPASASVDKRKSGYKNRHDAVQRKPEAAVNMIHDALAAGIQAAFVLMDTWFTNEPFIKKVIVEGIDVIRTYGRRWSIEVFFRASKSLLDLGDEFQGFSYDMTVSSTAVVFTRYIILKWLRRKSNDQKTICELFMSAVTIYRISN